jgi:hypothetical protein
MAADLVEIVDKYCLVCKIAHVACTDVGNDDIKRFTKPTVLSRGVRLDIRKSEDRANGSVPAAERVSGELMKWNEFAIWLSDKFDSCLEGHSEELL